MSDLLYYYVENIKTQGGGQNSQQQQWLNSGAWNEGLHHTHPWMQNQMLPRASINRTQGNALNIPVSAPMYDIFNSQGNTQVNFPLNLGAHTSVGESNQASTALQPPANKVAYEAPMSYMQLLLAAEEEGARYASSQSQEDRLVRTEVCFFLLKLVFMSPE
uniref:Uncharacterized protein n=1 Tax=Triticum urartu TaxID=4572 RepID=A0A8R7Q022_TRIUA